MTDIPAIGSHICDGVANQIAIVQVWNPANSGYNFQIEQLEIGWTAIASVLSQSGFTQGFDLDYYDQPLSDTGKRNLHPKLASMITTLPIELRIQNFGTPYPPSIVVSEAWNAVSTAAGVGSGEVRTFTKPIILPPGMGLLVRPAQNDTYTILSVHGTLCPVV